MLPSARCWVSRSFFQRTFLGGLGERLRAHLVSPTSCSITVRRCTQGLRAGRALSFRTPSPWLITAIPFALIGDRAVTASMILGFALYGYAATRALPALRDPRLLSIIYINTFLIEGLVSFQMAFIWACVFFFLFVEAVDMRRWPLAALLAVLAVTTHPFAGAAAVGCYAVYAAVRRPRDMCRSGPRWRPPRSHRALRRLHLGARRRCDQGRIFRRCASSQLRGLVVALPLIVSAFAPAFRRCSSSLAAMALSFTQRIDHRRSTPRSGPQLAALLRRVRPFPGSTATSLPGAGTERPRAARTS
jgi:hypothetical protein